VKRVGCELGGMALGGGETADRLIDRVYVDQSRLEDWNTIDELGDGRSGCPSGAAALGVKGDGLNAPIGDCEGNAREISTGGTPRGARKGPVHSRSKPAVIAEVVLEKLPLHRVKG